MKKHITKIFAVLALSVAAVGCSEEKLVVNGESYEIQTYEDFLWQKDIVDTIKFEINTEFRECEEVTKPITLALCDCNGTIVPTDVATVYVNGAKSDDNKIRITPKNGVVDTQIGIVIAHSALMEDCNFAWNLQSLEGEDGMKVLGVRDDETEIGLAKKGVIFGTDIYVKNTHVANSLKVWTFIILWTVLIALATIIVLVQLFAKRFKVTHLTQIFITANGLRNGVMGYKAGLKGSKKIILTSNPKIKQSIWSMLFHAKTSYVYVPGWPAEIELRLSGGSITHEVLTEIGCVKQKMDSRTHAMVLDCSVSNSDFKLEYMM